MGLGCKKHAMQGCMSGEDTNSHSGLGAGSGSGAEPMEVDQGAPLSRNERPIGAARALPKAAEGNGEESKYGTLTMSGHVPTTREIESGAVVVEEVQAVKDTDSVLTADLQPLDRPEEQFQVSWPPSSLCPLRHGTRPLPLIAREDGFPCGRATRLHLFPCGPSVDP